MFLHFVSFATGPTIIQSKHATLRQRPALLQAMQLGVTRGIRQAACMTKEVPGWGGITETLIGWGRVYVDCWVRYGMPLGHNCISQILSV